MRSIILSFLLALTGCETVPKTVSKSKKARVTMYSKHEDKWGSRTASGRRAKVGRTIAAEKAFPMGTKIHIPELNGIVGDGHLVVEDRGSAIEKRKASHGTTPVIDLYVASNKVMKRLAHLLPEYMTYIIE